MCKRNIIETNTIEQNNTPCIHGVVCSLSCDKEEHERTGFSSVNYTTFTSESMFDQINDGIKAYIDLQGTIF